MDLTELPRGRRARIEEITADEALTRKLLEMGLLEGMDVRLLHVGPVRRDPIAVEMNDRCIALRRRDAQHIQISLVE